ncbi:phosphatidate cytidylyltransferase [Lutimonas saemankumensis]|uniref:phosphatidate cytidylyltransferase n=1 Tax=Lutimonas saemankumensis TaxID=483016 RepID=UPI001CD29BD4|nr:phosphatidate cytidylyltransferase [Lutimonas saemankumensis]MCA0932259.1 phosphatidate cytidylyltransferase [Lutimonas saemankumensis]
MNNFTKRIVFGLLYVGLIIASTTLGAVYFYSLFLVFMMLCIYEFIKIIDLKSIYPYLLGATSFFTAVISNNNLVVFEDDSSEKLILSVFMAAVYFSFILALVSSRKIGIQYLGKNFLTLMYIIVPFSLLIKIPYLNFEGRFDTSIIIGIFILIWSNDVFAFLIGKNFGKHKLIERVSPNKTVEGFLGGFIFTFIAGYIVAKYCPSIQPLQWFTIAILVSTFGVLGDLIESMFKRQAKIKDSSNLLPGHGGFLDRLDSVIFATPFIFIYLFLTT